MIVGADFYLRGRTIILGCAAIFCSIMNLFFNYLLFPIFGVMGIALSTMVVSLAFPILIYAWSDSNLRPVLIK